MSTIEPIHGLSVRRETVEWATLIVATQLLLLAAYAVATPNLIVGVTPILVPLVWIPVGVLAIARVDPPVASDRDRTVALAVATGYFGILGYAGGVWGPAVTAIPAGVRFEVLSAPPGWAPRLFLNAPVQGATLGSQHLAFEGIRLNLVPWQVIGYVALAYLVYVTILDAKGSAISGVVGLLSCVSCTWPVIATLLTGVVGGTTAVVGAVYDQSYLLSTGVFVLTVALLYWRPGWR